MCPPVATKIHGACHAGDQAMNGLVVLNVFVAPDPLSWSKNSSRLAGKEVDSRDAFGRWEALAA
jgi:hypothetical protein